MLCNFSVFKDMTDNSGNQLVVRAKFNFQQTNEDELSFTKGDVIHVTRVEEGGWWEGTLNGRTGWFPSNYVREVKPSGKWWRELGCQRLAAGRTWCWGAWAGDPVRCCGAHSGSGSKPCCLPWWPCC